MFILSNSIFMHMTGSWTGRNINGEPGNQIPTKSISWGKFFGRIHLMLQIDRASLTKEREIFWQDLIFCDRKHCFVPYNNFWGRNQLIFIWHIFQLARESRYIGQDIGQGGEVPTKQNILFHPAVDFCLG